MSTARSPRATAGPPGAGGTRDSLRVDVLIQYLVRPGYAEVRTEEPQPGNYVYYIRVDWPKLRALAAAEGHPLERSE